MSVDVSVAAQKARARLYAASFEPSVGPAGVSGTRKEPPLLADRHERTIQRFYKHVPFRQRAAFRQGILGRLSGFPADAAITAAIGATPVEIGFPVEGLKSIGLNQNNKRSLAGGGKEAARAQLE